MKKFAKLVLSLLSLAAFGLAGCGKGGNPSDSKTQVKSIVLDTYSLNMKKGDTHQIEVTFSPASSSADIVWTSEDDAVATVNNGLVTAIGEGSVDITATVKGTTISDKCFVIVAADFHDYVKDGNVQLNLDYANRDFYVDGIEKVELLTPIDGDTAHFNTASGEVLKARFFGIDTPESTGKVQPWGVPASNFTKEKLKNANKNGTIVVSSPQANYGTPDPDSTGNRYVSLVWINETVKNAPLNQLYLLNLWIVQEGLSLKKNTSDYNVFENYFSKAEAQAKTYKLNMWSDELDPTFNYSGDYQDVSLLDIRKEVELSIKDSTHKNAYDNQKIRFTGVVSSYHGGTLFVQEFYPESDDNPEVGEWAGINIYCGPSVISSAFTTPNTYLQIYGLCKDSETFGFQVTDTMGRWNLFSDTETDCKVLLTASQNIEEHSLYTFHYTVSKLNNAVKNNNCEPLFCSIEVEGEITCNYFNISDNGAITLGFEETNWNVYINFQYHGDKRTPTSSKIQWETEEQFAGKKFRIDSGTYAWHRTQSGRVSYQVIPVSEDTFICTTLD